jgi:hypothetical protein
LRSLMLTRRRGSLHVVGGPNQRNVPAGDRVHSVLDDLIGVGRPERGESGAAAAAGDVGGEADVRVPQQSVDVSVAGVPCQRAEPQTGWVAEVLDSLGRGVGVEVRSSTGGSNPLSAAITETGPRRRRGQLAPPLPLRISGELRRKPRSRGRCGDEAEANMRNLGSRWRDVPAQEAAARQVRRRCRSYIRQISS